MANLFTSRYYFATVAEMEARPASLLSLGDRGRCNDTGKWFEYTPSGWVEDSSSGSPHAATHAEGGDDEVSPGSIGAEVEGAAASERAAHEGAYNHGLLHSNALDHSNANDPAAGEKAALAGTSGTPGSGNKYVTDGDARNTNARTPTSHSHPESEVTNLVTDLAGKEPANANIQAHVTGSGSPHTAAGVGALAASAFAGLAKISVGTSAPGSPSAGDLWVDTN
jgi:hypothetical protein